MKQRFRTLGVTSTTLLLLSCTSELVEAGPERNDSTDAGFVNAGSADAGMNPGQQNDGAPEPLDDSGTTPGIDGGTEVDAGAGTDGLTPSPDAGEPGTGGEDGGSPAASLRVGDPGVTFDMSKLDPNFPQMERWMTAGVRGGIPFLDRLTVVETIDGGSSSRDLNAAIGRAAQGGGGAILLRNGAYRIDRTVEMESNVYLVGESRDGVVCTITMTNGNAFFFGNGTRNSGIYRLTIQGGWGEPTYDWNYGRDFGNLNAELPGNENVSVMFRDSVDCFLDGVNIYNSGDFPVRSNARHITFRDIDVDGVHNKQGGAHGYFFILNGYNLMTGSRITHLRHLSLQGDDVEYNVLYDNDLAQEVSFHSDDDGNNLVENNRIILPPDMPHGERRTFEGRSGNTPYYRAIMGPWSTRHELSRALNYIYRNTCVEENFDGNTPWSNPAEIYVGPVAWNLRGRADVFPSGADLPARTEELPQSRPSRDLPDRVPAPRGGTLYPVVLAP